MHVCMQDNVPILKIIKQINRIHKEAKLYDYSRYMWNKYNLLTQVYNAKQRLKTSNINFGL